MTVAELIAFLQKQPQNLQVVHEKYSEYKLLDPSEISTKMLCTPRLDGWIHDFRRDKPMQLYVVLPGN